MGIDQNQDGWFRGIQFLGFTRHQQPRAKLRIWIPSEASMKPFEIRPDILFSGSLALKPFAGEVMDLYGDLRITQFDSKPGNHFVVVNNVSDNTPNPDGRLIITLREKSAFFGNAGTDYLIALKAGEQRNDIDSPIPPRPVRPAAAAPIFDQVTGGWFAL
ncbi:hypothetical protein RM531_08065 [Salinisphaera sp. P385]|uniref:Uncharacterized protein n=1 Tax=Spectribacter acetivorans TaxID=3075603 RepID=A0ABU3B7J7_9GAMM|nr:hypothetical protein [Salinisphaera sp. P385]MDT0618429.1 hypothetical protein [Salinisphaera sp. P385]